MQAVEQKLRALEGARLRGHRDGNGINNHNMRCAAKRPTALICAINAVVFLYVFYALFVVPRLAPLVAHNVSLMRVLAPPPNNVATLAVRYTQEEMERVELSREARRAVEPWDLMARLREIGFGPADDSAGEKKSGGEGGPESVAARGEEGRGGGGGRQQLVTKPESEWPFSGAAMVRREGMSTNKLDGGKIVLEGPEIEDGIIPGPPLLDECNAEPHTDYDGVAVTWGLTHPQDSAAECCQACLDQARMAKEGELKCNVWVYCPAEEGCFSPDIYEHKQFECWLKQAENPGVNFKGRYSPEYRQEHPTCPQVVPWASGVISSA